jgi:hypothetical protein
MVTIRGWSRLWRTWLLGLCVPLLFGCEGTVEPDLTNGEQIRQLLDTGTDESILFSSQIFSDQTGTLAYTRTVDSVKRGFIISRGSSFFYDDSVETQGTRLAFEARILDTLFGTVSYNVGGSIESHPYSKLAYGGTAKFLQNGSTSTHPNAWYLWRMQYRHAEQGAGDGSPSIDVMTISSGGITRSIATTQQVRVFRDSVLTLAPGTLTDVTIDVTVKTTNDSFFVTYPVAGGYETAVMAHDSIYHTATVQVSSTRRYELLAVQGFKSDAFTQPGFAEATAVALRSAAMRFSAP